MKKCIGDTRTLATGILLLVAASLAQAQPLYAGMYKQKYGYAPSCNACHRDGGGSPLGAYGKAFKDAGESMAAFDKIAAADSDGDGAKIFFHNFLSK